MPTAQRQVTVVLRKDHSTVTVSRSEAANMRLLGLALTEAEVMARIKARWRKLDKVQWHVRQSGYCGPLVMQMQR